MYVSSLMGMYGCVGIYQLWQKNALSMPNYNYKHSNQTDVPFRSQFITNIHVYIHTYIHTVACTHTYMDVHTSRDTYFVYYLHPQKKPILKVSSKETPNAARQQITNKQTNRRKRVQAQHLTTQRNLKRLRYRINTKL